MDYGLAMGTFRWEWRGVLNLHHVFMLCVFCIHDNEMCICLFLVFSILSHLTVAGPGFVLLFVKSCLSMNLSTRGDPLPHWVVYSIPCLSSSYLSFPSPIYFLPFLLASNLFFPFQYPNAFFRNSPCAILSILSYFLLSRFAYPYTQNDGPHAHGTGRPGTYR